MNTVNLDPVVSAATPTMLLESGPVDPGCDEQAQEARPGTLAGIVAEPKRLAVCEIDPRRIDEPGAGIIRSYRPDL